MGWIFAQKMSIWVDRGLWVRGWLNMLMGKWIFRKLWLTFLSSSWRERWERRERSNNERLQTNIMRNSWEQHYKLWEREKKCEKRKFERNFFVNFKSYSKIFFSSKHQKNNKNRFQTDSSKKSSKIDSQTS